MMKPEANPASTPTCTTFVAATLVPVALGVFGLVYGAAALALGAVFVWYAVALRRTLARPAAVRLFHYSLLYLALLFVAMAIDPVLA